MASTPDKRNPSVAGYFIGTEVENTPYLGCRTLFVVGGELNALSVNQHAANEQVEHVYLAANQSFSSRSLHAWVQLSLQVCVSYPVTLDVPLESLQELAAYQPILIMSPKVHILLSIKARYIHLVPNLTLKLDDTIPDVVNPGVWCIPRPLSVNTFTPWSAYADDSALVQSEGNKS